MAKFDDLFPKAKAGRVVMTQAKDEARGLILNHRGFSNLQVGGIVIMVGMSGEFSSNLLCGFYSL